MEVNANAVNYYTPKINEKSSSIEKDVNSLMKELRADFKIVSGGNA